MADGKQPARYGNGSNESATGLGGNETKNIEKERIYREQQQPIYLLPYTPRAYFHLPAHARIRAGGGAIGQ